VAQPAKRRSHCEDAISWDEGRGRADVGQLQRRAGGYQPDARRSGWPVAEHVVAGIGGDWSPRELRDTLVSLMSESGIAVEEIAHLAGHSSSRTTEVVYRYELCAVITTGADAMDNLFDRLVGRAG
jgi:integrase